MFCLTILFLHFLGRLAPALPVIGSTSASSVGSLDTSPAGCSSSWKLCAFICFAYHLCPDTRLIVAMVGRCCVILAQCAQWLWQWAQFLCFCAESVLDYLLLISCLHSAHQILLLCCASWWQLAPVALQVYESAKSDQHRWNPALQMLQRKSPRARLAPSRTKLIFGAGTSG